MWIPPVHSPFHLRHLGPAAVAGPGAVRELEEALGRLFDAPGVRATASGTHALQLALGSALQAAPPSRRRVALPAFACYDLVTAAVAAGAPVVFYDLDPATLGPVPASLDRAAEEAGVVVAANLFGFPLDWTRLRSVAARTGALLVEDAAQGLGSEWEGRPGGSLGDVSILSFGRGKGWTGGGGGGLLVRDERLLPGIPPPHDLAPPGTGRLGHAARAGLQHLLGRPALYGLPARLPALGLGETVYHPPGPPGRIHPAMAALALRSRGPAHAAVPERRRRARGLMGVLEPLDGVEVPRPPTGGVAAYLRLPLLVWPPPAAADELRRAGVVPSYPRPLPELLAEVAPSLASSTRDRADFPGARRLASALLTAPTHSRAPLSRVRRALLGALTSPTSGVPTG